MNASLDPIMERALIAEKRLSEALALAESNGKLAHDAAIELREAREQRDRLATALRTWQRIAYAGTNHEGFANARHQTDAALDTLKGVAQ